MRVFLLLLILMATPVTADETIRIAVASNFKPTLEKITAPFLAGNGLADTGLANNGSVVTYSVAATGALATQILHGAQYDLFFAADREMPLRVVAEKGLPDSDVFCYARGKLVLTGSEDGLSALANPEFSLAIANPVTAPYGRAATEVLARPEFMAGAERKLVRGNSVAQALQFWQSGAVDLALLPKALQPMDAIDVPLDWHQPIEQYAVVLKHSVAIDTYVQWLRSDAVRSTIINAGYAPCS
jgi:molybdate transport system substrate-binding protein